MIWRALFFLGLIALVIGALADERQLGVNLDSIDKLVHFGAFFALALLGALGWPRWMALFLIGLPVFGVAVEAAQTLTPAREFDWLDAAANGAGVGVGVTLATLIVRRLRPYQNAAMDERSGL